MPEKQQRQKELIMKKTNNKQPSDLLPEYRFDYSKMKPNHFAQKLKSQKIILLDPDVAKVFPNGKIVNDTLRAIANIIPKHSSQRKKSA
ncbi:MAG: hypothetical protein FD122_3785 [Stygiobacter sp.]|nr:MAG: hypothetical protein FD122_3785 [Stygiobacter sp.]